PPARVRAPPRAGGPRLGRRGPRGAAGRARRRGRAGAAGPRRPRARGGPAPLRRRADRGAGRVSRGGVTVIGLDAATLDVVRPLADGGELPHLARLLARGAHGE